MSDVFGYPLVLVLVVAGLLVLIASVFVHWIMVILGLVLIAAAVWILVSGGAGPI